MDIIIWLAIGALAGWLAGTFVKGGGFGLIADIVIGIVGSYIGGWLLGLLHITFLGRLGFFIAAFVGAVVLLYVVRLIKH